MPDHPYAVMYPDSRPPPAAADHNRTTAGYTQFVPACSSAQTTSYQYSVRSNDPDLPLDVFFVPGPPEYRGLVLDASSVRPYPGCEASGYAAFAGRCDNVSGDGGLLIWVPDSLDMALTKITVNLREAT